MTRHDYMIRLESCLTCIDRSEREAALRYYEEYFDDAGPDKEAEVISDLGSPESLARKIIAGMGDASNNSYDGQDKYSEFHSINAELFNSEVRIEFGREYRIDMNFPEGATLPKVSIVDGMLSIVEEERRFSLDRLFSSNSWRGGRITVTVPDVTFNSFRIKTLNGGIRVPQVTLDTLALETVNGGINVDGAKCRKLSGTNVNGSVSISDCAVTESCKGVTVNGSVRINGSLKGAVQVSAVNGSLKLGSSLSERDYDITVSTVSGSVRINGEKRSKDMSIVNNAANRIKASTVNGSVSIEFGV